MRFSILTLFPDQVRNFLSESIIGRALKQGIISLDCVNIRDFADNDYGKIDDTLYGGMRGLLIQCEPVYRAWESVGKPYTLYVSPKGSVLDQKKVMELSKKDHICILCGHYEGVDDRVISEICDEEISIGDYVLTGGEIAAVTIVDSVSRMIEGVLPAEAAYTNESHMNGTLEAPQYTKPRDFEGHKVPEVLFSGNHEAVRRWRKEAALERTRRQRPELYERFKEKEARRGEAGEQ